VLIKVFDTGGKFNFTAVSRVIRELVAPVSQSTLMSMILVLSFTGLILAGV